MKEVVHIFCKEVLNLGLSQPFGRVLSQGSGYSGVKCWLCSFKDMTDRNPRAV